MASEFDLIHRYFTRPTKQTILGVGDDAALVKLSPGMELAISTDMLVAGTHFFTDADPYRLGWKTLAVNLSDMAAMGALAKWATLAIAMPNADENWIAEFAQGFFACADAYQIDLIGGDTSRGPLTLSVTIMGEVPSGQALRRDGAKVGDGVWVSGTLGNAAMALAALQGTYQLSSAELEAYLPALHTPEPRVELGLELRGLATSAIDISDGLLADLGHILQRSNVGVEIQLKDIPCSKVVGNHLASEQVQKMVLAGGDDYELCFTAPQSAHAAIVMVGEKLNLQVTRIGQITDSHGLQVIGLNNEIMPIEKTGYDHFL